MPAGIEGDAFADQRDLGILGLAPGELDQAGRFGGGAADGMDHREVLLQQLVAGDHLHVELMALAEGADFLLERLGAEVVGRRVDQVARQVGGVGEAIDLGRVGTFHRLQHHGVARLAVAVEAIGAEAEGERGECRIAEAAGEPVLARLKRGRGLPEEQRRAVGSFAEAEEVTADDAALRRSWTE